MFDLSIPYKSITSLDENLTPGFHVLKFKNFFENDGEVQEIDWSSGVFLSDYDVEIISVTYNETMDVLINVKPKNQRFESAKLGIATLASVISSIAIIFGVSLIFVKGEKIIYIPSIAIITVASVFLLKQITGFFK